MKSKFEALGTAGLIQDVPGYALKIPAVTSGENFRTDNDALRSTDGYAKATDFDIGGGNIAGYLLKGVKNTTGDIYYHVVFGNAEVGAFDGTTWTDIAGALTISTTWSASIINGNVVATNGVDAPLYWDLNIANDFVALAGWNVDSCQIIRAFKGYLFAIDIIDTGVRYPYRFKWSEVATSGVPIDWDETDPATGAGEVDLGEENVRFLDGLPLRDVFFLYSENQTISVQFIGGVNVWRFHTIFRDYGVLARNCVVAFKNQHFVIMDGDVRIHDGHSSHTIIDQRNRNWLFDLMDPDNYLNTFCTVYEEKDEIWICFPSAGNTYANKALIWNYNEDTWARRDIPSGTTHISSMVEQTGTPLIWTNATMTWASANFKWGQQLYNPTSSILFGAQESGVITQFDTGVSNDGVTREARIERLGIQIGEEEGTLDEINCVTNIYPHLQGDATFFEIGASFAPEEGYVWEGPYTYNPLVDYKIDCLVSGRYHGIRVYNNASWRLSSIEFEYESAGER